MAIMYTVYLYITHTDVQIVNMADHNKLVSYVSSYKNLPFIVLSIDIDMSTYMTDVHSYCPYVVA